MHLSEKFWALSFFYMISNYYSTAMSQKNLELLNSQIWLAEIETEGSLDFPI